MTTQGLGSSWAIGPAESTYATLEATTRVLPIIFGQDLSLEMEYVEPDIAIAGAVLPATGQFRTANRMATGSFSHPVYDRGMGLFLDACLGTSAITGAGPYTNTLSPGPISSHSINFGMGGASSITLKEWTGCVCTGWSLDMSLDSGVVWNSDWVAATETITTSDSVAGSLPASQGLLTMQDVGTVTVNGASPGCVTAVSFTSDRGSIDPRFCAGSNTMTATPLRSATEEVTGVISVDFEDDLTEYNLFVAGTEIAIVVGATAPSGNTFTVTANAVLTGSSPMVTGAGVVSVDLPFKCREATVGTPSTGFKIVTVSGDSAL